MVSSHGKKQRARQRARRSGASHASSAAGALHAHQPLPDMTALAHVPHGGGRQIDTDLAARLVAACRAACPSCQRTLAQQLRTEQLPTLAALAGAVYGELAGTSPGMLASQATHAWSPLAQQAQAGGDGGAALAAVEAMDTTACSDLLEDALDHWAVGDPLPAQLREAGPATAAQDVLDRLHQQNVQVIRPDDLGLEDLSTDPDEGEEPAAYGVFVGTLSAPDGQQLPVLTLYPETRGAGYTDLHERTGWQPWPMEELPETDARWRLRAGIGGRSLQELVRTGPEGEDAHVLWQAAESVSMDAEWWELLDRAQHILIAGPVADAGHQPLQAAADTGRLLAVIARVTFH